ncbi:ubiquitin carboxyl-terminal hydrolase 30 isoform X1 [Varanus komodoensis]|uniref:ubiquitin carboxyl-terminal hydrolase 30 isoform X1 n=2 Tax=Varanus komodoensis TaxID=61221 RepID=UPI001CF79FE1|nr:ubiquitin carboxyl-terminal hydrolase 30 isoform X1 [Varanus komodoensis]
MLLSRRRGEEADQAAVRRLLRAGSGARSACWRAVAFGSRVMKNWGMIGGVAAALAASIYVLWGPITERKKRQKGLVPGLLNLGNTCFMNSLLQGLSACPSLIRWLERFTGQCQAGQSETPGQQRLSLTLLHLLKALSCQEAADNDLLDASCLLEVLRTYRWQISSFEEQDAHELFHVLTSSLEDEWDRRPRVTHLFDVHSLEQPEIPPEQILSRTKGSLHPVWSPWRLQHPFHGRLTSNMVCKHCKHQSPLRYDTFDSLSLSIPAAVWGRPLTLDHCLHQFISSESVRDVVCEHCTKMQAEGAGQTVENQRTTFVKQLKLGKLPQCLCIHLQRLSWSQHGAPLKRNEHVQFGELLAMDLYRHRFSAHKDGGERPGGHKPSLMNGTCSSALLASPIAFPFLGSPDCSSPAYLYCLMAVVVHHGDMRSGHFVTYRRSPPAPKSPRAASSQWLWTSDDVVRKATLQEVLSSSAYLLFYERVRSRLQHRDQAPQAEE